MERLVRWRGQSAVYTVGERQIMRQLPIKEQAFVHLLKSFTDGEIRPEVRRPAAIASDQGTVAGNPVYTDPEVTGKSDTNPVNDGNIPLYTDPEDIPFGKPKKTYALAWTPHRIRSFRTRDGKKNPREAVVPRLRTWKRWYERQGWTVFGSDGWHIAKSPDGELHAAIIREYDVERKKRL